MRYSQAAAYLLTNGNEDFFSFIARQELGSLVVVELYPVSSVSNVEQYVTYIKFCRLVAQSLIVLLDEEPSDLFLAGSLFLGIGRSN